MELLVHLILNPADHRLLGLHRLHVVEVEPGAAEHHIQKALLKLVVQTRLLQAALGLYKGLGKGHGVPVVALLEAAARLHPVVGQILVQHRDAPGLGQGLTDKGHVVGAGDLLVGDVVLLHKGAAEQLVPRPVLEVVEEVVLHLSGGEHRLLGATVQAQAPGHVRDDPGAHVVLLGPEHQHVRSVLVHTGGTLLQHGGVKVVVRVQEGQVLALGLLDALVAGRSGVGVGLGEHLHPGIPLLILPENLQGAVGGAIVHTDDLNVIQSLSQYTVQAGAQVLLHVVYRDNHRNLRFHFFFLHSFSSSHDVSGASPHILLKNPTDCEQSKTVSFFPLYPPR